MKKILKARNNLVRRVLSKTSNLSQSSTPESTSKSKKNKDFMSGEEQLAAEIRALKIQVENLKGAISALQDDTERKEVAIAQIAREKEKITMELLKQRRSNSNLLQQLEDERKFYYKEKEMYCQEMNQFKKLKQTLSSTSAGKNDAALVEQYKKEIAKVKQTLHQTLEANYNLSIKFLRMKNTKTCLKTQFKTMQLEHEKLVNDYKTKIHSLSEELNDLIQERLNSPISCSSKKYLHLVKQNSCLVYENLCLQLEVDNLHLKYEKLKIDKTKSETNSKLKYIKHDKPKSKAPKENAEREPKKVRIKEERPEKLGKDFRNIPSTSSQCRPPGDHHQPCNKEGILKIFERNNLPGIPNIQILNDAEITESHASRSEPPQIPSVQEKVKQDKNALLMKNVLENPNSKLALFQVSNISSRTSTVTNNSGLVRVRSSPEIARTGSLS